jgi:eukaryotic-like serine/threonine-protein kinase
MTDLTPARWAQIDALFAEALDRPSSERLEFLASACREDRKLFEAVRSLLEDEAAAGELIGESVTDFAADLLSSLAAEPGEGADDGLVGRQVGPYRLMAELGRGGMGAVYRAERADGEFEKRVALKLVKRGMDTDEILRRFRFERRILASLEHPNIARLYDGGAADDGRPYLVMELVEGERITDYCDARRLTVPARLALFRSVCAAVQHAHQNLVVHRDLKPSNILVTEDGTAKLLDFGIAKLLDQDAGDAPETRTGVRILTPEYAAPEQVRGEPVTTASDVYALGAVLYELLTGRRPFERRGTDPGNENATAGRAVTRPSSAVTRPPPRESAGDNVHGASAAEDAAARGTTPDRLRRLLAGDLDTVVLKALEEDPTRRYQSAQQLLEDLDRSRDGLPVLARPPALSYRAGKFARRHRVALAAGGLVLASLLVGLGAALWQADRAAAERDRAEHLRLIAEDERDAAEQVAAFLEGMFAASDPFSTRPGRMDTIRIGAFLERGAARIGSEFTDRPLIRARMLGVLGRAYRSLGVHDGAESLLEESLQTYRSIHGDGHTDLADALNALGNLYLDQERAAEAESAHRQALELRRALLGPDDPLVAASLNNLAAALQNAGKLDEAESLYDELLAIHRRLQPPDSSGLADALNTRMALIYRRDDMEAALPLAREILAIDRALFGDAHPRVARSMNNLAQVLMRTGAIEEAEPLLQESLAMNRQILGGEHPNIAAGAANLAGVLVRLGRHDEAEPLYVEAIAMNRRLLGNGHPALATALSNFADLLAGRGDVAEAEGLYREALVINRAGLGPGHVAVGIVSTRLAATLCDQGRLEDGRALYGEGLGILRAALPEQHSARRSAESGAARCGLGPESDGTEVARLDAG